MIAPGGMASLLPQTVLRRQTPETRQSEGGDESGLLLPQKQLLTQDVLR